jgi:hypothetical protein
MSISALKFYPSGDSPFVGWWDYFERRGIYFKTKTLFLNPKTFPYFCGNHTELYKLRLPWNNKSFSMRRIRLNNRIYGRFHLN